MIRIVIPAERTMHARPESRKTERKIWIAACARMTKATSGCAKEFLGSTLAESTFRAVESGIALFAQLRKSATITMRLAGS
jgi:hypothetical protein